jgi:hypothetical protein
LSRSHRAGCPDDKRYPAGPRFTHAEDENTCEGMPTMATSTPDRYLLADKTVWRIGYGAMQLAAGDGGQPRDLDEALAVLPPPRRADVRHELNGPATSRYSGVLVTQDVSRR